MLKPESCTDPAAFMYSIFLFCTKKRLNRNNNKVVY